MTYPRVNCLKTIPFKAAHPYIAHIWEYPIPPGAERSAMTAERSQTDVTSGTAR